MPLPDHEAALLEAAQEAADLRVRERRGSHEVPLEDVSLGFDEEPHEASLVPIQEANRETLELQRGGGQTRSSPGWARFPADRNRCDLRGLSASEEQVSCGDARDEGRNQNEHGAEDNYGLWKAFVGHEDRDRDKDDEEDHGRDKDDLGQGPRPAYEVPRLVHAVRRCRGIG